MVFGRRKKKAEKIKEPDNVNVEKEEKAISEEELNEEDEETSETETVEDEVVEELTEDMVKKAFSNHEARLVNLESAFYRLKNL